MQPSSLNLATSSSLVLLLSLLACFTSQFIQKAIAAPANSTVPAVLVFGDSIVDTGNNNYLSTLAKCNFPPYGKDFMGGIPTGRFSNGKVPSDLIVEGMGIKELLPAYLDPNLTLQDLVTGVNFASGGGGYDPLTSTIETAMNLWEQLKLFEEYIEKVKSGIGEERSKNIASESLYVVCTGSNDIATTYFPTPLRKLHYDIASYTDLLVQSASTFIQELYRLGARKIIVINIPPIGCVPSQRTIAGGKARMCVEKYNKAAMLFNSKLSSQLNLLNNKLPQSIFLYIDIYNPVLDLIQNPYTYGFEEATKGCCGTGKIETSILLCDGNPFTCTNTSKYIFWDSYHPTEKAYKVILAPILNYLNSLF
ncbi:GDSL esterase/lipase EXL1-like [Telopea speciosissima]|uniref:GDSL esterase/lipase EXL1-like n=1 Tax=Telopea speciosissima TaxID=54955 RepID=UPI001CC355C1|nr:GDSL esterase/lipase EXL1-like [Telopea speciosissima]XP_043713076.1 GDSL esterase/lipase EXL1-like [Telopea speciosissima]